MQATRPVDQANLFNTFFHSVFLRHPIMAAHLIVVNDLTLVFNTTFVKTKPLKYS